MRIEGKGFFVARVGVIGPSTLGIFAGVGAAGS